mgnify:CR=1 FL=1
MKNKDWLQKKAQEIFEKHKLMEYLGDVAGGSKIEYKHNPMTMKFELMPADTNHRLKAIEMLRDTGFGKPAQMIDAGEGWGDIMDRMRAKYK